MKEIQYQSLMNLLKNDIESFKRQLEDSGELMIYYKFFCGITVDQLYQVSLVILTHNSQKNTQDILVDFANFLFFEKQDLINEADNINPFNILFDAEKLKERIFILDEKSFIESEKKHLNDNIMVEGKMVKKLTRI